MSAYLEVSCSSLYEFFHLYYRWIPSSDLVASLSSCCLCFCWARFDFQSIRESKFPSLNILPYFYCRSMSFSHLGVSSFHSINYSFCISDSNEILIVMLVYWPKLLIICLLLMCSQHDVEVSLLILVGSFFEEGLLRDLR